jgi:hypothetical protein
VSLTYKASSKKSLGDPAKERARKMKPGRYGDIIIVPKELGKPKPIKIPAPEPRPPLKRVN